MNAPLLDYEHMLRMDAWLERRARTHPEKIALVEGERLLGYRALAERVEEVRAGLHAGGVSTGDRVILLTGNRIELVEVLFAAAGLGAITVPLNYRLSARELGAILEDCRPRAMVVEPELANLGREAIEGLEDPPWVLEIGEGGSYEALLGSVVSESPRPPPPGLEDPAIMVYTSGTTGGPKGVVLSHRSCLFQSMSYLLLGFLPTDVVLCAAPLFHVGPLGCSLLPSLLAGVRVVLQPRFETGECLRLIEEERITTFFAVPTMLRLLTQAPGFWTRDLSSLATVATGGEPMTPELYRTLETRGVPVLHGYGLSEAGPTVTAQTLEHFGRTESAGPEMTFCELRVVDEAGRELPDGEAGELHCRGPNLMNGYWGQPEATREAMPDGWLRTGDLAVREPDGHVRIVGRSKDMILTGGENVFPAEIESVLETHPDVAEVAVLGLPDPRWGERVVAAIVPRDPDRGADEHELVEYCRSRLGGYKTPRELYFRYSFPRNAVGKVQRRRLRDELMERRRAAIG